MSTTLTETERVIAACAEAWEVDIEKLLGRSRGTVSVSDARFAVMHILARHGQRSHVEIEHSLKRRSRSAQYGLKAAAARLETDPVFRRRYKMALELIQQD